MARDPCQPPLVVMSTVQPSWHRCQNLVSQGSYCAAHIAASCGQALLAASKHVDRKALPSAFSRSIGCTTSASCPCLGAPAMSFAQPRTVRTISAKFVGSTPLRSLSMRCSITQLSVNFIKTSARTMGQSLREQGCGNCCPGSGFFGPQSCGAIVAAVHSFAVRCGTIACVHVPIHSRNTAGFANC